MRLFRAAYLREGRLLGVTFAAHDPQTAASWARDWERQTKLPVLTLKEVKHRHVTGEGSWARRVKCQAA